MKIQLLKFLTLVLCLVAAACATAPETVTGPDGTPHQLLTCYTMKDCYAEATQVCLGKYQIVNTSSEVSGDANGTSSRTLLLIKCKN